MGLLMQNNSSASAFLNFVEPEQLRLCKVRLCSTSPNPFAIYNLLLLLFISFLLPLCLPFSFRLSSCFSFTLYLYRFSFYLPPIFDSFFLLLQQFSWNQFHLTYLPFFSIFSASGHITYDLVIPPKLSNVKPC